MAYFEKLNIAICGTYFFQCFYMLRVLYAKRVAYLTDIGNSGLWKSFASGGGFCNWKSDQL